MTDIWLKLSGTDAQARAAFVALGMDKEMLHPQEVGPPSLEGFNHHVATVLHPDLMVQRGTYGPGATPDDPLVELTPPVFAGPYLMIRIVSSTLQTKALDNIINGPALPAGLELADPEVLFPDGPTVVWA